MYKKRIGPKMDPSGTPYSIFLMKRKKFPETHAGNVRTSNF